MKTNIEERLSWLWRNGYDNNIPCNSEKICIIHEMEKKDFMGLTVLGRYGSIEFDRWFDAPIFFDVDKNKRFVPNKIGKLVSISHSDGSAWLNFDMDFLASVVMTLQKAGYTVKVKLLSKEENKNLV